MSKVAVPPDLERHPVAARLRWWASRFGGGTPGSRRLSATLIEAATELELQAAGPAPLVLPPKET